MIIRRFFILDLLSFLPVLIFINISEALVWMVVTFGLGVFMAVLSFQQLGVTLGSIVAKEARINMEMLPVLFAPGLAGILFILPGLMSDLIATIIILLSLASFIKKVLGWFDGRSARHQHDDNRYDHRNRGEKNDRSHRVIVPDYETIDDNNNKKG